MAFLLVIQAFHLQPGSGASALQEPVLSDNAVEAFTKLAQAELGLDLDYSQARESATQVLRMHFLKKHCAAALRPEGAAEAGADATPPAPDEPAPKKRGRPRTRPVVEFRPPAAG